MAPAGTPQSIIDKLHDETVKVLNEPDVRARLNQLGLDIIANTPAEFAAAMRSEIPQWAKVIKGAGIRVGD
jgi:tripartite-type tricarboxylate transporter receptor subunit TctC